jgi:hypothetical protein
VLPSGHYESLSGLEIHSTPTFGGKKGYHYQVKAWGCFCRTEGKTSAQKAQRKWQLQALRSAAVFAKLRWKPFPQDLIYFFLEIQCVVILFVMLCSTLF